jgi:hypothetical protein
LYPRILGGDRDTDGSFRRFQRVLESSLSLAERDTLIDLTDFEFSEAMLSALSRALPSPHETSEFYLTQAEAMMALQRSLARSGAELHVAELLVAVQHFPTCHSVIGLDAGARGAQSILSELLRAALKSDKITLGALATLESRISYFRPTLLEPSNLALPATARCDLVVRELHEAAESKAALPRDVSGAGLAGGATGGGSATGYPAMYAAALRTHLASKSFRDEAASVETLRAAGAHPHDVIVHVISNRDPVLLGALFGHKKALPGVPLVSVLYSEYRSHGPACLAALLAELALPEETEAAPRATPPPATALWDALCRGSIEIDWENTLDSILAACSGYHQGHVAVPATALYTNVERLRRLERVLVPFFERLGWVMGATDSLDTVFATLFTYHDNAHALRPEVAAATLRTVVLELLAEASAACARTVATSQPSADPIC